MRRPITCILVHTQLARAIRPGVLDHAPGKCIWSIHGDLGQWRQDLSHHFAWADVGGAFLVLLAGQCEVDAIADGRGIIDLEVRLPFALIGPHLSIASDLRPNTDE